jgi:HlyD family secretion protein
VKGVIVDRRVNIGQTVVSSLNAPSLFLIAKDLKRVQVWAAVNEVDISRVHAEQTATFTVDAYPGKTFQGTVIKVRLNASMTQNVVTYTVEVRADNQDGLLLPYLTANVAFVVSRHEQVLAVPNTALHWSPAPERIDPEAPAVTPPAEGGATLWVAAGARVRPIAVRTGASDGTVTEVEGADLQEDLEIVTGEVSSASSTTPPAGSNPFTPQMQRGRRSS